MIVFQAYRRVTGWMLLVTLSFILVTFTDLAAQEYEGKVLVEPQMFVDSTHAVPGETLLVGVHFKIEKDWHIYWKYPGDAGMPTRVAWELPEEVEATELDWPLPHRIEEGANIEVYAYGDEAMMLYRIRVPEDYTGETLPLKAAVTWLVCREVCIPGSVELVLDVPVGTAEEREPQESERFIHWQNRQPVRAGLVGLPLEQMEWTKTDKDLVLTVSGVDFEQFPDKIDYYPLPGDEITIGHPAVEENREAGSLTVTIPVSYGLDKIDKIEGLLVAESATESERRGWQMQRSAGMDFGGAGMAMPTTTDEPDDDAAGTETAPSGGATPGTPTDTSSTSPPAGGDDAALQKTSEGAANTIVEVESTTPATPLLTLIFFAFLGGLILNIMPCVLPAISLKIFGFIEQAGEDSRKIFLHGLSFTAGILLFFLGIGVLAIAITAGGGLYTWGSQFQNPIFVIFLTTVVFVFALNLFGIFEISLPGSIQTGANQAAGAGGYFGSFLHGLLATLLATACTAPFMGVALTGTLGQPPVAILAVFGALGLGMASPYLLLSANPGWLKVLPKPGRWMEFVKQFMGFLLMATVIWLFSVLIGVTSVQAAVWTLVFLLGLGLAAWLWGIVRPQFQGDVAGVLTGLAIAVTFFSFGILYWQDVTALPVAESAATAGSSSAEKIAQTTSVNEDGGIEWQEWSPEAVRAGLENGRTVFVDFTADWCVTCQSNKRLVINTAPVEEAFAAHNVLALKADWTRPNKQIQAALHDLKRIGIPVNVFYSPEDPDTPVLLPVVLTKDVVINTLESLSTVEAEKMASS